MRVVAFVPIKLNSERLANKNILPLGDHCISWYIFNTLLNVPHIDDIYVYCSNEIIRNYIPSNVKFLKRPEYLDENNTLGIQIYTEFAKQIDADIYILAHTTSPFISVNSISVALQRILDDVNDSALSVNKHKKFAWYNECTLNYDPYKVIRTQELKPVYLESSAFYMFKKDTLQLFRRRIGCDPFLMETSYLEGIDIDTKEEYELAQYLLPLYLKTLKTLKTLNNEKNLEKPLVNVVILDFDGTMSDGKITCTSKKMPNKSYNVKDGYIIKKLSTTIKFILLSGNDLSFFKTYAKKLGISEMHGNCHNKVNKLKELEKDLKIDFNTTLYIGDDDNDIEAMKMCKVSACPKDASPNVINVCNYVSQYTGGNGAVREILNNFCEI